MGNLRKHNWDSSTGLQTAWAPLKRGNTQTESLGTHTQTQPASYSLWIRGDVVQLETGDTLLIACINQKHPVHRRCKPAEFRGCLSCTCVVGFPITLCALYSRYTLLYFTSAGETAALKGCSAGRPQCFSFDIPASLYCKLIQLCKSAMPEWSHHWQWTRSNALRMN